MSTAARRIIGTIVALAAGGGGLFWYIVLADETVKRSSMGITDLAETHAARPLLLLPLALIVIAAATLWLTRIGVVLFGGLLTLAAFVGLALAVADTMAIASRSLGDFGLAKLALQLMPNSTMLLMVVLSGSLAFAGLALLIVGLMGARARSRSAGTAVLGLASALVLLGGVLLSFLQGNELMRQYNAFQAAPLLTYPLIVLAALIFCAGLVMSRWSAAGLMLSGAVLLATIPISTLMTYDEWARPFFTYIFSGLLGVVGAALFGLGIGTWLRQRRDRLETVAV